MIAMIPKEVIIILQVMGLVQEWEN